MENSTFLSQASEYKTFHDWLKAVPREDLERLSAVNDDVSNDELKPEDEDTAGQIAALCIHFSGKVRVSEKELEDLWKVFTVSVALELNVRQGNMTIEGHHDLLEGSSAKFKMTDKGMKSVENMLKDKL